MDERCPNCSSSMVVEFEMRSCLDCGYMWPIPDDPEMSIEAWEWWCSQEAHGNDIE